MSAHFPVWLQITATASLIVTFACGAINVVGEAALTLWLLIVGVNESKWLAAAGRLRTLE